MFYIFFFFFFSIFYISLFWVQCQNKENWGDAWKSLPEKIPPRLWMDGRILWYWINQRLSIILSWWRAFSHSIWLWRILSLSFNPFEEVLFFGYRWDFVYRLLFLFISTVNFYREALANLALLKESALSFFFWFDGSAFLLFLFLWGA